MRNMEILPPLAGVSKSTAYQMPPDYTTYDSLNMWPFDYKTGRRAYATRCPLSVAPALGAPVTGINMMGRVNGVASGKPNSMLVIAGSSDVYWYDTPNQQWVAATGAQASSIETARTVLSKAFLNELIISNGSGKPFVFSHSAATVTTMVETAGTVPDGLTMFAVWNGALVAAGATATPNVLYMSRIGDAHDWDFAAPITDTAGAFFTGGEDEGLIRGAINAIIPLSQDVMIVSTDEGLVAFQGHPRQGGIVTDVANIRVAGPQAWCRGPGGELYFASPHDIYKMEVGASTVPVPVSRRAFPAGLGASARFSVDTILTYEPRWNSVVITDTDSTHYDGLLYDIEGNGFHPMSFGNRNILVTLEASPAGLPGVGPMASLYGGNGGNEAIESFSEDNTFSETFTASFIIGPIRLANTNEVAKIQSLTYQLGDVVSSGLHVVDPYEGMTLTLAAGKDGYDSINRLSPASQHLVAYEFPAIRNNGDTCYPQLTGNALAIQVSRTAVGMNRRFSMESIGLVVVPKSRNRMFRKA